MTSRKSAAKKWTLIVLIVFVLIAVIGGTYSRYTNTGSGTGTVQVAKWAVKINNSDLTATNASFNIAFYDVPNAHVVANKIAPASQVYADFVIDPTGSEVSLDYEFTLGNITASAGTVPTGLAVSKVCTVSGDTETEITPSDGKYTGTIALTNRAVLSASDKVTVRVYVSWPNNESNNATDTNTGIAAPSLSMTVNGTASQHIAQP